METAVSRVPGAELLKNPPKFEGFEAQMRSAVMKDIPGEMWAKIEKPIRDYIDEELYLCQTERKEFMNKVARWRVAYDAPLPTEPKNFPIFNASNLTVPLIKETVNTLVAQAVQMSLTAEPRWILEDLADEWEPFVDELERFMHISSERDLELEDIAIPWIVESMKLGTSIMEMGHEVDERSIYQYTPDGSKVYGRKVIRHDGPVAYHVPLENFWIRLHETKIQKARWVAKRQMYSKLQLEEKAAIGKFNSAAVKKILAHETDQDADASEAHEESRDLKPIRRSKYEVFEVWISWPVGKGGRYTELRLYYHKDTQTFIAKKFHPYWHGRRPFVKLGFFPREHSFYDEGLAEMLEGLQEEMSTQHNQRLDNASMANLKMIVKRRLAKGLKPGDPLYMGKIIEVNDIHNDLREFNMAEIYPSTITNEELSRQIADRLVGLNEAVMGSAMPVTRTTAYAQMALLQEQAKRIGLTVSAIRKGLSEVGHLTLLTYYQYGTNGKAIAWLGERGKIVEAVFRLPKRLAEVGLALKTNVPTSLSNRQIKRENALAQWNLLVQMYKELSPLINLAPEATGEFARAMVKGANKFMGDVLETFETSDPEEILAGLSVLERVLPSAEDLGGLEAHERGAQTTAIVDKLSRLESTFLEAAAAQGRGDRVRPDSSSGANGDDASIVLLEHLAQAVLTNEKGGVQI